MREAEAYTHLAGVYDEIVVDPCYSQWAAFLHSLWQADDAGVHDVLDVCCGTGLLAAELIPLGYRVVGVDAAPAMLDRARTLLGPDVDLRHVVLPDLPVDGPFDAAVSTFDGLNYLTPDDLRRTFAAIAERLRPGGWLVFDIHTDAAMAFTATHPVVEGEDHGHRFVITNAVDTAARTIATRIELLASDGDDFAEVHRQYFHSDEQVKSALADAGLLLVSVQDEYTATPAADTTLRATWLARRAG